MLVLDTSIQARLLRQYLNALPHVARKRAITAADLDTRCLDPRVKTEDEAE
tara:strand:- start:246 stop:398 length:153 start_codon:yes stop_codon:yes gene_type:complete